MTISDQLIQMSDAQFWLIWGALGVLSFGCFIWAFRLFHRGRVIENTPTAKVRSAQQGYVELIGTAQAVGGEPISAPLTGRPCCWYRYRVDKRVHKGWKRVDGGVSDTPFLLRDDTGDCLIDPEGAEVLPSNARLWYGDSREPSPLRETRPPEGNRSIGYLAGRLMTTGTGVGRRYRYSEARIHPGEALYAVGLFKSTDDLDRNDRRREITRELLKSWKEDQASLLNRFDANGDGRIDAGEWDRARDEAERLAGNREREQESLRHLHAMGRPRSNRHPFLLSAVPESQLIRRYRLRAGLAITAFFLSGGATIWALGLRLA